MNWPISIDASRSLVLGGLHSVVLGLALWLRPASPGYAALGIAGVSALTLLVTRIGADHHDPPMPTDHPALVTNWLDARVHLHGCSILFFLVV
jgi:hypothetical protein